MDRRTRVEFVIRISQAGNGRTIISRVGLAQPSRPSQQMRLVLEPVIVYPLVDRLIEVLMKPVVG